MIDLSGFKIVASRMAQKSDVDTPAFQDIISQLREYKSRYHTSKKGFGLERWAWDIDNPNMIGRQWEWSWATLNGPNCGAALDIGSGYRPFSFLLQKELGVTCVDNSDNVISACLTNGMKTVTADMTNIPLPDEFADVIYCISVLEHLGSIGMIEKALKEMRRLIKPQGRVILTMDVVDMVNKAFGDLIEHGDNLREPINGNEIVGIILEKV